LDKPVRLGGWSSPSRLTWSNAPSCRCIKPPADRRSREHPVPDAFGGKQATTEQKIARTRRGARKSSFTKTWRRKTTLKQHMHFAERQQEENNNYFATSKQKHHIKTRSRRTPQSSAKAAADPTKFLQFCPHPAVTKIALKFVHLDSDPDLDQNGMVLSY